MDEFVGRMRIQREVLTIINSSISSKEPLFGLASKTIGRWVDANHIEDDELVKLVRDIASLLFFLSTKSQDPVSEDYKLRSVELDSALQQLRAAV